MESDDLAALRAAQRRLRRGAAPLLEAPRRPLDAFVHAPTGIRFPPRLGPFSRGAVTRLDGDGTDLAVAYERQDDTAPVAAKSALVSIFLDPVPPALADAAPASRAAGTEPLFAHAKADLGDVTLEAEVALDPPLIGYHVRGTAISAFDGTVQPVAEALWLHADPASAWVVTCRATWPIADEDAGRDSFNLVANILAIPGGH